MFEAPKRWAQARMAPVTWERSRQAAQHLQQGAWQTAHGLAEWLEEGRDRATTARTSRFEPWRIAFAVGFVLIVALILTLLRQEIDASVSALLLLVTVGLSTYLADWVGGVAATIASVIAIDVIFAGDVWRIELTPAPRTLVTLVVFVAVAALTILTIERLKTEGATARLETASLRAANTALSAVEIAAAQRPAGNTEAYAHVMDSILIAMAQVNRASVGALYLVDASGEHLVRAAIYGENTEPESADTVDLAREVAVGEGFAGQIAQERRPITVRDAHLEPQWEDVAATNPHVRAVAGVPLIDPEDNLVGVAWVGLYVAHQFAPTAVARLQALSLRTIAFMEGARLADDQEALLDQVQDNHRRLQSVIQTIPEAVMVVRPPHGLIVASNAAAQRMFGISADGRPDGRRVSHLHILPSAGSEGPLPIQQALAEAETVTGVELNVRLPSGKTVPVVAGAAPLRSDSGDVDAVVAIFQDVSALKEAERLRDEFISVVSHELRSPLTPIRGFAQVVARELEKEGDHEQQVEWLGTLQHHADRMTRLIDDLLDVSRLRAGRLPIQRSATDLVQLCKTVVSSRKTADDQERLVLETDLDNLVAEIDSDRIHQVIDNLVSNALKYAPEGEIRIGLGVQTGRTDRQMALLTVTDHGPGIPLEDQDHLFSPFYRSRSASESAVPGLGLGLYISRELVEAHGGRISVGDGPDGGTRFSILLPTMD